MKKYALSLTSAFNSSALLKARLLMLYKKPSAKVALGKYGFVVPLLLFCGLITAFTQRERILPASLLVETNKVAQRLQTEFQKAFLPAVASKSVEEAKNNVEPQNEPISANVLAVGEAFEKSIVPIIEAKPIEIFLLKPFTLPTKAIEMPVDSSRKDKGKKKKIRKNKWLPYHEAYENYSAIKHFDLDKSSQIDFGIVLDQGKPHTIRFYDTKTENFININANIKISQVSNNSVVPVSKTNQGYEFIPPQNRAYRFEVTNIPQTERLTIVVHEKQDRHIFPHMNLLDEKNQAVKSHWDRDNIEIDLNQNFKINFYRTGSYTDLQVHEVLITVRNKKKGVTFEKIIETSVFNLGDLPVKKDDWVVITVTEFSGKFNGEIVKNPKQSIFRSEYSFSIDPLIK